MKAHKLDALLFPGRQRRRHRRQAGLPDGDRAVRLRARTRRTAAPFPDGLRREARAVRRQLHRHGVQRAAADRAGLRLRAGDEEARAARPRPRRQSSAGCLRTARSVADLALVSAFVRRPSTADRQEAPMKRALMLSAALVATAIGIGAREQRPGADTGSHRDTASHRVDVVEASIYELLERAQRRPRDVARARTDVPRSHQQATKTGVNATAAISAERAWLTPRTRPRASRRTRARTAARHPDRHQGHHQHHQHADHRRRPGVCRLRPALRRARSSRTCATPAPSSSPRRC